jgi:hypothetical protein
MVWQNQSSHVDPSRYKEALDVLYDSNTLHFDSPFALVLFFRNFTPNHLDQIRHLRLSFTGYHLFLESGRLYSCLPRNMLPETYNEGRYDFPGDTWPWRDTWEIIGQKLTSLRTLRVELWTLSLRTVMLNNKDLPAGRGEDDLVFGPMKQVVRGLNELDFWVGVRWKLAERDDWEEYPFRVEELERF